MLFRGRQPEASIWRRFRTGSDGFTFTRDGEVYATHIVANAERVVDLFYALTEHLPPAVDVYVEDLRSDSRWTGEALPLPDVREAIARLKVPLAAYGGVEIAVFTSEDQITLNPDLELFIYARTDQWLYILQGKGLQEQRAVRAKTWRLGRGEFQAAPDLVSAVAASAERLGLTPA